VIDKTIFNCVVTWLAPILPFTMEEAWLKCARSWKILPEVGTDPDYPDVTPRDADALREWDAANVAA
jgi:isoleucyl-tRNA synthetase